MMLPSADALAALVPDGALLAMPPDNSLPSVAIAKALVRRGARNLRAARRAGVGLRDRHPDRRRLRGGAGDLRRVAGRGRLRAALLGRPARGAHHHARRHLPGHPFDAAGRREGHPLHAAARRSSASDILANRPDWKVVPNPFAEDGEDPIVLLPARQPDFAIFHAAMADSEGNVWLGRRRECATIAHASKAALVTVERFVDGNFLEDERLAPGRHQQHLHHRDGDRRARRAPGGAARRIRLRRRVRRRLRPRRQDRGRLPRLARPRGASPPRRRSPRNEPGRSPGGGAMDHAIARRNA